MANSNGNPSEKAEARGIAVELCGLEEDRILQDAAAADFVVSTPVLCSVPDVDATLAEVLRILRVLFLEHVGGPPGSLRRLVQKAASFTPWNEPSGGCRPGRDLARNLAAAGFDDLRLEAYLPSASRTLAATPRASSTSSGLADRASSASCFLAPASSARILITR